MAPQARESCPRSPRNNQKNPDGFFWFSSAPRVGISLLTCLPQAGRSSTRFPFSLLQQAQNRKYRRTASSPTTQAKQFACSRSLENQKSPNGGLRFLQAPRASRI